MLVIAAIASAMIGTSAFAFAPAASADSTFITIKGVPSVSVINTNPELVQIHGHLATGNPINQFTVIVDKGSGSQRTYVFFPDGKITHSDVGLISVDCDQKVSTDGYYLVGPAKINCVLSLDKTAFSAGAHNLHVDALQSIGTLSANGFFILKPNVPHLPDLVASSLITPSFVHRGNLYTTWVIEKNQGIASAGNHVVSVYLSSTTGLTSSSQVVGEVFVPAIAAGATKVLHIQVLVPNNYPLGSKFFVSFVDSHNDIVETTKANNQQNEPVTVIP